MLGIVDEEVSPDVDFGIVGNDSFEETGVSWDWHA
jgi:hypothetical protein